MVTGGQKLEWRENLSGSMDSSSQYANTFHCLYEDSGASTPYGCYTNDNSWRPYFSIGGDSNGTNFLTINLYNPYSTKYTNMEYTFFRYDGTFVHEIGGGLNWSTTAASGLSIFSSSGSHWTGDYRLYGIK